MGKIKIGNRWIGEGEPVYIIAEAGSNHNGSLEQAKELIDVAAESKADAVKFQLFKAERLSADKKTQEILKNLEFRRDWLKELNEYAKRKDIMFLATPFDEEAVDQLDNFVPAFKVSGYDIDNFDLLNKITEKEKPIILSTGASYFGEVEEAVNRIYSFNKNAELVLLHCVNQYPTQFTDVNLRAMVKMKDYFNLPVGLSDHTLGIEISIAAVSLGANVIEKHFTLDRSLPGPDHSFAAEPTELRKMVESVRNVEKALGTGVKKPSESELENRRLARRSIHAKKDIKKGEIIRVEHLVMLRPALGINPNFKEIVVGRKAKKNIKAGSMITWEMI